MGHRNLGIGSNWWLVSGRNTTTGNAMLASDPHLALSIPSVWYEVHLNVSNDPLRGPLNVDGVSFPGTPGVTLGCNDRICWGATVNPMDVTDTYQESLVFNFATMTPAGTVFENTVEPVQTISQTYLVNQLASGKLDNLVNAQVSPLAGGLTVIVPRRNNGPIISVDISNPVNITGLSVQYTGWGPTCELAAFLGFTRAQGLNDFRQAMQYFSFGSQNFGYADVDGNIAYFAGGAMPLREDLQTLGYVDGAPPFLIRDGTHHFKNEWLPLTNPQPNQLVPYEILPADEMPQAVNPVWGYLISANNDPVGITLTNSPLSFLRPGGGIYYLGPGFDAAFRAGRITELIQNLLASGGKIALPDMQHIQANNQMLDAQVFTPYILAAFANAQANGAPAALAALANDAGIVEAMGRLANWDFSTPTGIQGGYDPGDDPNNLPAPSDTQIQNSVAATIYQVWRGQFLANTIDAALKSVGLGSQLPRDDRSLEQLRLQLDNFWQTRGRGASGMNFFPVANAPTPEAARDILILQSIRGALNLLASSSFAPAYNRSTSQIDYRWGKLHRVVLDHPLGGSFNVPPAGGFTNLATGLSGIARSGGFEVVDASTYDARADNLNDFMFDAGPSRRLVAEMAPAVSASQAIPGGESGIVTDPAYANLLGQWLTNGYHPLYLTTGQVTAAQVSVEQFTP
jgi:penicillin amidase